MTTEQKNAVATNNGEIKTTSMVPEGQEQALEDTKQPLNFIEDMKVTYKTSKAFGEEKAKMGDFFLSDQSLGAKINVIAITYRFQILARDDTGGFLEKLVLPQSDVKWRENKAYIEFMKKHINDQIEEGADILCFLPDFNLFGSFFAKKKLAEGGILMLKQGGDGRVLEVSTVKQENTKKTLTWYTLDVRATAKCISDIKDKDEKTTIFENSIEKVATAAESAATSRPR